MQQRLDEMMREGAVDPMNLTGISITDGPQLELLQRFIARYLPRTVVLDDCGLTAITMELLVDVLKSHRSLTSLSLQRNALDASRYVERDLSSYIDYRPHPPITYRLSTAPLS